MRRSDASEKIQTFIGRLYSLLLVHDPALRLWLDTVPVMHLGTLEPVYI